MMINGIQFSASKRAVYVKNTSHSHRLPSSTCAALPINWDPLSTTSVSLRAKPSSGLLGTPVLRSRQPLHVCLAGGKGMMADNNQNTPWKSLEGQSIEDLLHQQIRKGESYENGGNGRKPPRGGRGGGGGGSSGGSDDGGFAGMSDETLQIVLASIGFIFVYICVIDGVELAKLTRDCIGYMVTGKQSVRLKRAMFKWVQIYKKIIGKKEVETHQSENETTWNNTDFYRDSIRNIMKPNSDE